MDNSGTAPVGLKAFGELMFFGFMLLLAMMVVFVMVDLPTFLKSERA